MLEDVPLCCPNRNNLIKYVSLGQVLKVLAYLHLTLWLLRDMCCEDKGSVPQSIRQSWGEREHLQCWKK